MEDSHHASPGGASLPGARLRFLRWQSRRGLKELDVLLERFLDAEQESLAGGAWPEFEALLAREDDVLWDWLQRPEAPAAERYRTVLERIRRGAA
jgi:antitoxin CptB